MSRWMRPIEVRAALPQVARLFSALVVLAMLTGCTSSDADNSDGGRRGKLGKGEAALGSFDSVPEMKQGSTALPISPSDNLFISRADNAVFIRCMEDKGFPQARKSLDQMAAFSQPIEPYVMPAAELRRSGYGVDTAKIAAMLIATAVPRDDGVSDADQDAYNRAADGGGEMSKTVPDGRGGHEQMVSGGCTGDAARAIFGTVENKIRYDKIQQGLIAGEALSGAMKSDARYRAAADAWRSCMTSAGYEARTSDDYGRASLNRLVRARLLAGGPQVTTADQLKVAGTDADCQEKSGLDRLREELLPGAPKKAARNLGFDYGDVIAAERAFLARAKAAG